MARTDTLGNFLTDVADAIRTKAGTSETIQASNFDTAISNIPSGSIVIENIVDLNDEIKKMVDDFVDYYNGLPNSYTTTTSENIVLYTPNINYKKYLIQKRSNGKYRVVWTQDIARMINQSDIYVMNYESSGTGYIKGGIEFKTFNNKSSSDTVYYSPEFDTPEICIQKMKDNELTYTSTNSYLSFVRDTPNIIPYSNSAIYDITQDEFLITPVKISSNETFVQM